MNSIPELINFFGVGVDVFVNSAGVGLQGLQLADISILQSFPLSKMMVSVI